MPTSKSEFIARVTSQLNQQAVNALVDQLGDFAVENERLKSEIATLRQQLSGAQSVTLQPTVEPINPV